MFEVLIYILHGAATSPFVRKTWLFLKEKGLEFEHRQLDPLDKSERFLSMNPLGRIPVLEEADGNLISDSSVICDYLENVHPSPSLYPADNRSRAQALWFEEYADTLLTQPAVARALIGVFRARFDPAVDDRDQVQPSSQDLE